MRTSLLNLDVAAEVATSAPAPFPTSQPAPAPQPAAPRKDDEGVDFEIVFGRRQIASTGLVLVVVLACFSGLSYLIGKAAGTKAAPASAPASAPAPVAAPSAAAPSAPAPAAPLTTPVTAQDPSKEQPPVFAEAIVGKVYMQVGAVDKGLAGIWAEGLRTHGLDAFVSPGPSDKMWRVLVGPLPDAPSFQRAKDVLDKLGIGTFGRRYSQESPAHEVPAPDIKATPETKAAP